MSKKLKSLCVWNVYKKGARVGLEVWAITRLLFICCSLTNRRLFWKMNIGAISLRRSLRRLLVARWRDHGRSGNWCSVSTMLALVFNDCQTWTAVSTGARMASVARTNLAPKKPWLVESSPRFDWSEGQIQTLSLLVRLLLPSCGKRSKTFTSWQDSLSSGVLKLNTLMLYNSHRSPTS